MQYSVNLCPSFQSDNPEIPDQERRCFFSKTRMKILHQCGVQITLDSVFSGLLNGKTVVAVDTPLL